MANLCHLALDCKFGTKLDKALRDQCVSGLQSEAMHKRLLTEKEELDLAGAVKIAAGMEAATKTARGFQDSEADTSLKYVSSFPPCKHCGRKYHKPAKCRFKSATCHNGASPKPITVSVIIDDKEIPMEVDTGAGVSIIPLPTWTTHFPNSPLQKSDIQLKTYTKQKLTVLGQRDVTVKYGEQMKKLTVTVVDGDGPKYS